MVCVYAVLLYVIYFLSFFFFFIIIIDCIKPAIAFIIQKGHSMFSKICSYTISVSRRQDAEET